MQQAFKPKFWAQNRHLQTMWSVLFRRNISIPVPERRRLELNDGDFIDCDCFLKQNPQGTVLLLHGLEGSIESHYIRAMIARLTEQNKQVVLMHFRSCSEQQNRLAKSYHSGVSEDLHQVLSLLNQQKIVVDYLVGYSLGGNVLLKWLGEQHHQQSKQQPIKAAVAVSVPLLLNECATAIDQGFSKIYSKRLLKTLKQKATFKSINFPSALGVNSKNIAAINSFWQFDHQVTAPLHGFKSAQDYYQRVSSRQFLKSIEIPTLIIHAKDDPFMNTQVIPEMTELSSMVEFELNQHGGHVGFVEGDWPWKPEYYLDKRIPEFLNQHR
jgi:uncharacterized protein